jgi:DNA-directed RNA polymerase specialized sigma24 family protein
LFRINVSRLYALSLRLGGSTESANNITIDTFIQAYQNKPSYNEESTFFSWLKTQLLILVPEELQNKSEDADIEDSTGTGESKLFINEIDKSILALPDNQRVILVLHDIENQTDEAISGLLSLNTNELMEELDSARLTLVDKLELDGTDTLKNQLSALPDKIEPPYDLWNDIFNNLHELKAKDINEDDSELEIQDVGDIDFKESKEERKRRKKEEKKKKEELKEAAKPEFIAPPKKIPIKTIAGITAGILLPVAVLFLVLGGVTWEVWKINGVPKLQSFDVNEGLEFKEGYTLTTDAKSSALITIPDIGQIDIEPETSVMRLSGSYNLRLGQGKINVLKAGASELFELEVPSAVIEDYKPGGNYTVEVDDAGRSLIKVNESLVKVSSENEEVFVIQDYYCEVRKGSGPGIPYSVNASEELKKAIEDYSFSGATVESFNQILFLSEKKDALSVWNLLRRSKEGDREIIINKLHSLVELPQGVTPRGASKLDEGMLQLWLEEIVRQI